MRVAEINSGDDIYAWMERRHNAAVHDLCVISDEYLKAPCSTAPPLRAQWPFQRSGARTIRVFIGKREAPGADGFPQH